MKKRAMLFTIILEFEGTTSVRQFSGENVEEAYRRWFEGLKDPSAYGLNADQGARLSAAISFEGFESLTPLSSTLNVWCTTALVGETLALMNFVATLAATGGDAKQITEDSRSNELVAVKLR